MLKIKIMVYYYDLFSAEYFGIEKNHELILIKYHFDILKVDAQKYANEYKICIKFSSRYHNKY